VGDYIMRGIEGEFYPCGESIFNKTYEEVDSETIFEFDESEDFVTIKVPSNSLLIIPSEIELFNIMGIDIIKLLEKIQKLQELKINLNK